MSEVLKELFLNPVYFFLILVTFGIYTTFLLKYGNTKRGAATLEKIWILLLLLAITGVKISPFPKLNPSALSDVAKTPLSAIAQIGIYAYIILLLNSRFRYFFRNAVSISNNPFLCILLGLTVLSALWSETPGLTLKSSIVLLGTSAFAAYVGRQYSWQELSSLLRWSNTLVALLSIPVALLVPSIGIHEEDQRWQGVLSHPIYLGTLMALNIVLWYSHANHKPKHRFISLGLAFISFIVMLFAKSAGAVFNFFVVITLLVLLRFIKRLSFAQAFISIIVFIILGIAATILILNNMESILNVFGKDVTFTGRTEFWPHVVEAIKQRPWLGHGYKGFWQPWEGTNNPAAFITADNGWQAPHAHNGFLDIAVDLGVVGLVLFVLSFLQNVAQGVLYLSRNKLSESTWPLILLIFLVMANISDSRLLDINYIWFCYVFLTVRLNLETTGGIFSKHRKFQEPASL